jgi:hypothetical protein
MQLLHKQHFSLLLGSAVVNAVDRLPEEVFSLRRPTSAHYYCSSENPRPTLTFPD